VRRRRAFPFGAWIGRTVAWSGLGLAAGLLAAVGVPPLAGFRSLTVMSGSMEPAVTTGDVVVNEMIRPLAARPGDVVSFRDPDGGHRMITHRLRRIQAVGTTVELETKGDANNAVERWAMPAGGRIGRVIYRVPKLGYLLIWAGSPYGRLALIALPTLVLGALALLALWRPGGWLPQRKASPSPLLHPACSSADTGAADAGRASDRAPRVSESPPGPGSTRIST
jgi:signal peptidase I